MYFAGDLWIRFTEPSLHVNDLGFAEDLLPPQDVFEFVACLVHRVKPVLEAFKMSQRTVTLNHKFSSGSTVMLMMHQAASQQGTSVDSFAQMTASKAAVERPSVDNIMWQWLMGLWDTWLILHSSAALTPLSYHYSRFFVSQIFRRSPTAG